jgi:gluconolactonase
MDASRLWRKQAAVPPALAFGPDGALSCRNNGGAIWGEVNGHKVHVAPLPEYAGELIQRIEITTGKVETLYAMCDARKLAAPNDILTFSPDSGFASRLLMDV